jgi:hypothetical protein
MNETIYSKGVVQIIFSFETPQVLARVNNQSLNLPRCFELPRWAVIANWCVIQPISGLQEWEAKKEYGSGELY